MDARETIYVVDTSVLMADPKVLFRLRCSQIVIPLAVIKELDGLKNNKNKARASAARRVTLILDELGSTQDIVSGAETFSGSVVRIFSRYIAIDGLASAADNKIVGAALSLKLDAIKANVIVLTRDGNMRNVTRAYGMKAENYPPDLNIFVDAPNTQTYSGATAVPH